MTTKATVKLNGQYDYLQPVDPTVAENEPQYTNGQRWLNTVSGDSFDLIDQVAGTWQQIEQSLDTRIDQILPGTYARIIAECRDATLRPRDSLLQDSPDSITKTAYWYLLEYISLYADWTITGASISADHIVGDLADLLPGDQVWIIQSRRNEGLHTIATVDASGLTFTNPLDGTTERFLVALAQIPADLDTIIGRMIWFDLTIRPERLGLSGERIGSYSYTVSDIGGRSYPTDVTSGIDSYLGTGPIVDVTEVW